MEELKKVGDNLRDIKSNFWSLIASAGYITGIILAIIGCVYIFTEIHQIWKVNRIGHWPVIKNAGVILSSNLEDKSGLTNYSAVVISNTVEKNYFRARVAFSYTYNGKTYNSVRVSYLEPWTQNSMVAKLENSFYTVGKVVDVLVNPNDPSEAYLINKPYVDYDNLLIGIILAVIGFYIVLDL